MSFRVACLVFTLAVWLICWFVTDLCARFASTREMLIDVGDVNDNSRACHVNQLWRSHFVFRSDAVKPDIGAAHSDFTVYGVAVWPELHAPRLKPERLH